LGGFSTLLREVLLNITKEESRGIILSKSVVDGIDVSEVREDRDKELSMGGTIGTNTLSLLL
jgi:hypothetical protein